jgi:hypothetical protein
MVISPNGMISQAPIQVPAGLTDDERHKWIRANSAPMYAAVADALKDSPEFRALMTEVDEGWKEEQAAIAAVRKPVRRKASRIKTVDRDRLRHALQYTYEEVGDLLGVSKRTVERMVQGKVKDRRLQTCGRGRVSRAQLLMYLMGQESEFGTVIPKWLWRDVYAPDRSDQSS